MSQITIFGDVSKGADRRGQRAEGGTASLLHNVRIDNGEIQLPAGDWTQNVNGAESDLYDPLRSIASVNDHLIVKKNGYVGYVDQSMVFRPLVRRVGGGSQAKREFIRGFPGGALLSPESLDTPVWPRDACYRWGQKSFYASMSYLGRVSGKDEWLFSGSGGDAIQPGWTLHIAQALAASPWLQWRYEALILRVGDGVTNSAFKVVVEPPKVNGAPVADSVFSGWSLGAHGCAVPVDPLGIPQPTGSIGTTFPAIYTAIPAAGTNIALNSICKSTNGKWYHCKVAFTVPATPVVPQSDPTNWDLMTHLNESQAFTGAAGEKLADGTYRYIYRYASSELGTAGLPSLESGDVVVSGSNTRPAIDLGWILSDEIPYWADTIEVYRARVDSGAGAAQGVYYLCASVSSRVVADGYNWLVFNTPGKWRILDYGATGQILPRDAYWNIRPECLLQVRMFNGRAYGIDATKQNRWRFSSIANTGAWPEELFDVTNVSASDGSIWTGGYWEIGGDDPILGAVPEAGAYSSTGLTGDTLIIAKRGSMHRWSGVNHGDFIAQELFPEGTRDGGSLVNCNGDIYYMGSGHVMRFRSGEARPVPVTRQWWGVDSGYIQGFQFQACHWNGNYVVAISTSDDTPVETLLINTTTGSISSITPARYVANCRLSYYSAYFFDDALLVTAGRNEVPLDEIDFRGQDWQDPISWTAIFHAVGDERKPDDYGRKRILRKVWVCARNITKGAQSIHLSVGEAFTSNSGTSPEFELQFSGGASDRYDNKGYEIKMVDLSGMNKTVFYPEVVLRGTNVCPERAFRDGYFSIQWVRLEWDYAQEMLTRSNTP